jgi:hypothetical protein
MSNGAPELVGEKVIESCIFDAVPEVLKRFFNDAFEKALTDGVCSSVPSALGVFPQRRGVLPP